MIANDKEYEITERALERFRASLAALNSSLATPMVYIQINAVKSVMKELETEMIEYKARKAVRETTCQENLPS